jgi:hypothetical protein
MAQKATRTLYIACMVPQFSRTGPVSKNTNACWYACMTQAFHRFQNFDQSGKP